MRHACTPWKPGLRMRWMHGPVLGNLFRDLQSRAGNPLAFDPQKRARGLPSSARRSQWRSCAAVVIGPKTPVSWWIDVNDADLAPVICFASTPARPDAGADALGGSEGPADHAPRAERRRDEPGADAEPSEECDARVETTRGSGDTTVLGTCHISIYTYIPIDPPTSTTGCSPGIGFLEMAVPFVVSGDLGGDSSP